MNGDSDACGCCEGVLAATPRPVYNRAGLDAVSYRIGTYADFKASLVAGLSSAARPQLNRLLTREPADFTIGLIDAFACAADVLTFYQERTANESWLRTAVERTSLQELGKLIGYWLRPGVAAETWLAFTVETPPLPPPNLPPEPGAFVTGVPAAIALPKGLKVQSVPGPGEKPLTFETVEDVQEARAAWNAARPWLADTVVPMRGHTFTYLAGVRTGLKAGDAVLFVDADFLDDPEGARDRWDFRILSAVIADAVNDRTRIEWLRGLGSINPRMDPAAAPRLFALRKRAAAFGHNAPMWASMPKVFKDQYPGGKPGGTYTTDWPNFNASARAPGTTVAYLDLDAVVPEAAAGSLAVVAKGDFNRASTGSAGTYVELYVVRGSSEVSRAEFALSGKVTRLELAGENFAAQFYGRPRELAVFVQSEELAFAGHPVTASIGGDTLPLALAAEGIEVDRRLIVSGARADNGQAVTHLTTVAAVTPQGTRCTLRLADPLSAALRRDSVVAHLNVALASHGETATQILGSGVAAQPFQRFELKQLPLTYRAAATERGAAAELTLNVGGVLWRERPTLFGAGSKDRVFTIDTDADGRVFVSFGDGVRGARLPSGSNNVRVTSRKGLGVEGNVRAETLTQLASRPLGLKGVANPAPASGGTDPEPAEAARRSMPLATRTLGRVVSLLDYEDYARAYAGIAKAHAAVLALRGGRTIVVTVAAADGEAIGPASPVWINLLAALKAAGDPLVRVQLLAAQLSNFRVGLKVKVDTDRHADAVLAAVEAELRAHFAFDARELGQPVLQSEVIAAAHRVPGVMAVDLDRLYGGTTPVAQAADSLQERLLANRPRVGAGGVPLPAELLTLDPAPLVRLEEMT